MKTFKTLAFCLATGLVIASSCGNSNKVTAVSAQDAVLSNIAARKSVRAFLDTEVTEDQMNTLLRAAMAAPSGHDVRPWSFIVLRDKAQFDGIFGRENHNWRIFQKSPAIVVICADTTVAVKARKDPDEVASRRPNGTWRDDMGACTQNFLLAAEAMGLGAVWTACYPYPDRMDPVRKALDLPDNVVPYAVVPVGYPSAQFEPKDKWDPDRIHYGKW